MIARTVQRAAIACLAAAALLAGGCIQRMEATFSVNADGTASIVYDLDVEREAMNRWAALVASEFEEHDDDEGEGDGLEDFGPAEAEPAAEEPEPDAEPEPPADQTPEQALAAQVRRLFASQFARGLGEGATAEITALDVQDKSVRITARFSFTSMRAMAAAMGDIQSPFGFDAIHLDKTGQGKLAIRLTADEPEDTFDWVREQLAESRTKGTLKITGPGAAVETNLPHREADAAWVSIDGGSAESLDAFGSLFVKGAAVTFEPGELDMASLPLDTASLAELEPADDLDDPDDADSPEAQAAGEAADAGPGYSVEPIATSMSFQRTFAEAHKLADAGEIRRRLGGTSQGGTMIRARLHAAPGRSFLAVERTRVIRAEDDRGRGVAAASGSQRYGYSRIDGDGDAPRSTDLYLQLETPAPGARAVERLEAETVFTSFGGWAEHTIDGPRQDESVEIDLADVLPGARLVVVKLKPLTPQPDRGSDYTQYDGGASVKLIGPAGIDDLRIEMSIPGAENIRSHVSRAESSGKGDARVRNVAVRYNLYTDEAAPTAQPVLTIRRPIDVKRERLRFELTEMDLF